MEISSEIKRFREDLEKDEALRARLDEITKRIFDAGEAKSESECLSRAAEEMGYRFSAEEADRFLASAEEQGMTKLDLDELDNVAGGLDATKKCKLNCPKEFLCTKSYMKHPYHINSCYVDYMCNFAFDLSHKDCKFFL